MKILGGLGVLSAVGPSAQIMMQLTASTAASSGSEDADGEELVEPPEPEATEPPSRRAAIRRLDGRRFSGAQAWPAPVAPCAHPFARRPRCWWRVSTQSASPTPLTCVHGCGRGEVPDHAWAAWSGSVLSSCLLCDAVGRGVLAFGRGQKQRAQLHPRGRPGGGLGGAMCMPRGRGRRPRAVARSQTCEDHTTTPRWRARARIVPAGAEANQ